MSKKKIIGANVGEMWPSRFSGTLAHAKEQIEELIATHGPDARLDWEARHYYPYDQEPTPLYFIIVDREENDEEFNKRIAQEAKWQEDRDKRDLAEFERLKKQFGEKK